MTDPKDEILTAASSTVVKLFENDDCSGDELEFKVSHNEQNCDYCLDTCNERFTTNPDRDTHQNVKSVQRYPDGNLLIITASKSLPTFKPPVSNFCSNCSSFFSKELKS